MQEKRGRKALSQTTREHRRCRRGYTEGTVGKREEEVANAEKERGCAATSAEG